MKSLTVILVPSTRKPNQIGLDQEGNLLFIKMKCLEEKKCLDFKQGWIQWLINVPDDPLLLFSWPAFFHGSSLILLLAPLGLQHGCWQHSRYVRLDSPTFWDGDVRINSLFGRQSQETLVKKWETVIGKGNRA